MIKHLSYPIKFAVSVFMIQQLFRCVLFSIYFSSIQSLEQAFGIFLIGIRFDLAITAYLTFIPFLLTLLLPLPLNRAFTWLLTALTFSLYWVVVYMEIAAIPFFEEYGIRPNRMMIEYLGHWREVSKTLISLYWHWLLLLPISMYPVWMLSKWVVKDWNPQLVRNHYFQKIPLNMFILALLFLFARGGRPYGTPMNLGSAVFSNNVVANQLAMNSVYTFGDAIDTMRHEQSRKHSYGIQMNDEDILEIVKKAPGNSHRKFLSEQKNPLLHIHEPEEVQKKPLNFVIILEESMGAEYVGILGGLPLTPHFDSLSKEGLLFKNLFSSGTRSARGIEAIVTGFLPSQGRSVIKLGLAQNNFFTIGKLLSQHDYHTSFIYGGDSNFDNMRNFSSNNGFQHIIDQRDFKNPSFVGTWGVCDEDLFMKANEEFKKHGDKPFFSLVFTSSNHGPFEFPEGKIKIYDEPRASVRNTIKYADYAVGRFFEVAKKESYYKNTIFLVVADHNWRNYGSDLVPIDKMRIPGLLIGPNITPGVYEKPIGQVDLTPSVIAKLGKKMKHPMLGVDIFSAPKDFPGRAVLQYSKNNAHIYGDDVVIHIPGSEPRHFKYDFNKKILSENLSKNKTLEKTAGAYALLPGLLYFKQLYH